MNCPLCKFVIFDIFKSFNKSFAEFKCYNCYNFYFSLINYSFYVVRFRIKLYDVSLFYGSKASYIDDFYQGKQLCYFPYIIHLDINQELESQIESYLLLS